MQKNNKKASILLWSIFMSLLLGAIFITASIEIQRTLEEHKSFSEGLQSTNEIESFLANNEDTITYSTRNGNIVQRENKKTYEVGLKRGDEFDFISTEKNTIKIEIQNGVVQYTYNNKKGIIINTTILEIEKDKLFTIANMSGYARIIITANKSIDFPKRYYKVIKNIAGHQIIKTSGHIINTTP